MTDLDKQMAEFKARGEAFTLTNIDGEIVAVPQVIPDNPVELSGTVSITSKSTHGG